MELLVITPITALLILLTAILSGSLGSLVGLGGSILLVPFLRTFFDIPMHTAISAGIISVIATSASSSIKYLKSGLCNLTFALQLEIPTVLGSIAGGIFAIKSSGKILQILFSILLLYISVYMIFKKIRNNNTEDKSADCFNINSVKNLKQGYFYCFWAGIISGSMGIGGGTLKVPIMTTIMDIPVKVAVSTSAFMVGITASAPSLLFTFNNMVNSKITALCIIGSLIGGYIGSSLGLRLTSKSLYYILTLILITLAISLIIKG